MSSRFQRQDGWLESGHKKLYVVSKHNEDIKAKFQTTFGYFYEVITCWESFNGCYWFQLVKENHNNNCYGFVQLHDAEFGLFSIDEINDLKPRIWEVGKINLPHSGITDKPKDWFHPIFNTEIVWKTPNEELFKTLNAVSFTNDELLKVIGKCSYVFMVKNKYSIELRYGGEVFGSYKLSKDGKVLELNIQKDEPLKKAILDFQAGLWY